MHIYVHVYLQLSCALVFCSVTEELEYEQFWMHKLGEMLPIHIL